MLNEENNEEGGSLKMVCVQNFRGLLNCRVSLNTVYANSKIRRPLCLTVFFLVFGGCDL